MYVCIGCLLRKYDRANYSRDRKFLIINRDDYYIPDEADKYVTVKPYESYDTILLRLDFHARVIQRNYRAYRLMKYIRECAQIYRDMLEKCKKYEEEKTIANK